jgi:tetrapyrrole methylase family protein/MazG family protein
VLSKIEEEIRELRMVFRLPPSDQAAGTRQQGIEAEFGDILFSLVNLARFVRVNPEDALRRSINRFIERFQFIEGEAKKSGRTVGELSFDEMNRLWDEAKRRHTAASKRVP